MSQATLPQTTSRLGLRQIAIIVLAVATGLVHLYRGLSMSLLRPSFPGGRGNFPGRPPTGSFPAGARGGAPGGPAILSALPVSLTTLFYLNFVGYIVLAIALYLPPLQRFQRIIRWVLIAYALLTIILWYLVTGASPNVLAYIDKPIEVLLIIMLVIDDIQSRPRKA